VTFSEFKTVSIVRTHFQSSSEDFCCPGSVISNVPADRTSDH